MGDRRRAKQQQKAKLYVVAADIHHPVVDWPTFRAMLDFLKKNRVDGFVFLGDQKDNQEISPYTKGKPLLRAVAGKYMANLRAFDEQIMGPVEKLLPAGADRIYLIGNHCDWERQYIEEHPEWDGIETHVALNLRERGWTIVERGKHFKLGKLTLIHGDTLSGIGNQVPGSHSKKAVDAYCSSVLYGHFHSPQTFTKVMPFDKNNKWMSYCSPIIGATNPGYLKNKPTAWINGFSIVEVRGGGRFNVYPVIVIDGTFSFGGKLYGK